MYYSILGQPDCGYDLTWPVCREVIMTATRSLVQYWPAVSYVHDVTATFFLHASRPLGPYPHARSHWPLRHHGYHSVHPHFVRISHNNIFLRMIFHNYTLCSLARTFCERLVQHSQINITNMLGVTPLALRCHRRAPVHGKLIHVPSHVI